MAGLPPAPSSPPPLTPQRSGTAGTTASPPGPPPASSRSPFHQIHQDPEHQNDDEAGRDQLAAVPAGGGLTPAHVHQHHGGDRQAAPPPGPGLALVPPALCPGWLGTAGFAPAREPGLDGDVFCLLCCLPEMAAPQPAPQSPGFLCPPQSPRVHLQDPCPILGVLADKPGRPTFGSRHRGRGQPQPWRGAPCPCQLLPAPQAGRVRSCCSGRAGGVPTSAVRSGVQASPFASAGAAVAPAWGGSSPGPPSRQDGVAPAPRCLHCWARRRGSLSSSALVWCLEPGPVSALPNRDLRLANAPRCASVSPGLGSGGRIPFPPPQRQMLCECAAPACACPHLPSPLWGGMGLI